MDTTKLIVEYLVSGALIVASTLFAIASWFPNNVRILLTSPNEQYPTFANEVILAFVLIIFIALSYGVGIVSEYIAEQTFEWLFDRIKRKRILKYVKTDEAILKNSPIFGSFLRQPKEKRDLDSLENYIGKMRFFVMNHSTLLYAEIAAQISRFRLIRVLFLVEVVTFIAIIGLWVNDSTQFWPFAFALALIVAIASANVMAVRSRFNRYCRAIERSYVVLMSERVNPQNKSKEKAEKNQ